MGVNVHVQEHVVAPWLTPSFSHLFFFVLLSCCCSAVTVAAPVNINLKSSRRFLKDLLGPNGASTRTKKVSIDWSGRYECQVTGRGNTSNNSTMDNKYNQQPTCDDEIPSLLPVDGPPYLQVGVTYDLQSAAGNSFFTKLQWDHVDWQVALEGSREQGVEPFETREPSRNPVLSTTVRFKLGKLWQPRQKQQQKQQHKQQQQQQQLDQHDACSMEIGGNSIRQAHVVARVPVSLSGESTPRFHAEYKAIWNDPITHAKNPPPKLSRSQQNPDWWIPDLQISTSGQLESSNTFCWKNRARISLRWSRSLGWFGDSDSSTRVRLEVTQRLSAHHSTTATLHGILEALPETVHVTLTHQHHVRYLTVVHNHHDYRQASDLS